MINFIKKTNISLDTVIGRLINEELNKSFINENKLYPSNIIFNLTKKIGDNSDDTLNKLAIFGLFRQSAPFNVIKDINQLQSLDQLNELFDKWKESALQGLITTDGPLKGNKTAALTYLEAYIKNIKSLGNNAKPFSYRDAEKTLIDVANNNGWVKSNDSSVSTYGIDSPNKQDILFEDNTTLIVKAPSKAKCIMYGQGYRWCISQTGLNMYNHYRVKNGATIYFVLNKTKSKEDVERTCVILRYSGDRYGIADATNTGDRSGGPNVAGQGFEYVESELPWLRGKGQYFTESEVTQSEKDYIKFTEQRYNGDDLGNYIINAAKEMKFNGEEIDPVDLLREYAINNRNITVEQFKSLTEPMRVQLIEMDYNLDDSMIQLLDSTLKVRWATVRFKNNMMINFSLYTSEERTRVLNNVKDILNGDMVYYLLKYFPKDQHYGFINQILQAVKDNLDGTKVRYLLNYLPKEQLHTFTSQILQLVKNNLDGSILKELIEYTPKEQRYNLIQEILQVVKDNLDGGIIYRLVNELPEEKHYDLIKQILPLVKNKLDGSMIYYLTANTAYEHRYELVQQIFPLVKDNLGDVNIVSNLLNATPYEHSYGLVQQIFPLIKDKENAPEIIANMSSSIPDEYKMKWFSTVLPYFKEYFNNDEFWDDIRSMTPEENRPEIESLINQYKQQINENKLNIMLKNIINEELNKTLNESITVYHGSDRKFDSFDTSKIGSGDGKSLGGWGIYFSTSEDVARKYTTSNGFVGDFEIPNGPYFNLDDNIDVNLGNKIASRLSRLGTVSDEDIEQLENDYLSDEYSGSVNNKGLYDWLAYVLGSKKDASLFLEKLGFVGNEFTDKMDREANNYVVFDSSSIKGEIGENVNEEVIDEATYPENFDLEKFKQLKSFKDRVNYCNSTLKKLGSGSSRIVYLVDDKTVLKLAKNQKGIAQNEVEIGASTNYYNDITAEVYESDENGLWLEMELAKPINKARFQQILGYTVEDFGMWISNFWNVNHAKRPLFRLDKQVEEIINESEFSNKVFSFVQDYDLSVGDLGYITSYGEFDGEVKIIDYGLNDDVLSTYYRKIREGLDSNENNKDMLNETGNESKIQQLRKEEQDELKIAIPNIEEYIVSGKVDKTLIKNNEDLSKYNEIYNKYDKLITPLLLQLKNSKQPINEVEPSEVPTKTIKYTDHLNDKIWDNNTKKLKPIVRYKLLEITKKYLETLKDLDIKFTDIILTGSAANYNYNDQSDLDVHVVVDYDKIGQNKDLLLNYFKGVKDSWSNQYKITIYGIPVEMFIQDVDSKEVSSASIYSLLDDKWVIEPQYEKPKYNIEEIKKIAADFLTRFDDIKREYKVNKKDIQKPINDIEQMKTDMSELRKKGLDSELGEFSNENLGYKLLRNLLFFDKVNKFKEELVHKQLSLKETNVITENQESNILPDVVYHGQPPLYDNKGNNMGAVKFDRFENKGRFLRGDKTGFYFTPIKSLAIDYAEGGNVYTCKLNIKNPYFFKDNNDDLIPSGTMISVKYRDLLKENGYDSVVLTTGTKVIEIVVFYNEQIEIINVEEVKNL